ncbi:MAG: hypothetical protein WCF04_02255, partial [Candidatus Nanopelagicales bacterium]
VAMTGATVAELQARIGHATPTMAMHYMHAMSGRDAAIALAMSALAAPVETVISSDLETVISSEVETVISSDLEVETVISSEVEAAGEDFTLVWWGIPGGRWHLAGDAGRSYCGRRLDPRAQRRVQDEAPGPACKACAQLRERRA